MSETSEYEKQILGKRQQNKNKLAELGLTPVLKHDIAKKSKEPKDKWPRSVAQHKKFTNPTAPKRSSDRLNRSTESAPSRSKKQQQKGKIVLDPSTICPPEQTVRHYHLKLMKTFERLYPMLLSGEIGDMIKAQYAEMRARAAEIRRALNEGDEGAKDELQRESRDPESGDPEANTRAPENKNRKKRRVIDSDSRSDDNTNNNINRNNVSSNDKAGSQHSGAEEDNDAEMRDVADEEHGEDEDVSGYQDNDEAAQYNDNEEQEGADDESNDAGDDNDKHSQDESERGESAEDEESEHGDQGKSIASSLRSHHARRRRMVRDASESSEVERSPDNFEYDDNYEQSSSRQGVSSSSSEESDESSDSDDDSASDSVESSAVSSDMARSRGTSNSDEASGSAESES